MRKNLLFFLLTTAALSAMESEHIIPPLDLAYDAKRQELHVSFQNSWALSTATYNLRTCSFNAQAQTLQRPNMPYDVKPIQIRRDWLLLLINRIRTYLILNNVDTAAPELAYIQRLFYTHKNNEEKT